jgi:hypothetical protein
VTLQGALQDGVPLEVADLLRPLFEKWLVDRADVVPRDRSLVERLPDETEQDVVLAICAIGRVPPG